MGKPAVVPSRAREAIAEIRLLLQSAYILARELEGLVPPKRLLDKLSDHIQSVRASTESVREQLGVADETAPRVELAA